MTDSSGSPVNLSISQNWTVRISNELLLTHSQRKALLSEINGFGYNPQIIAGPLQCVVNSPVHRDAA